VAASGILEENEAGFREKEERRTDDFHHDRGKKGQRRAERQHLECGVTRISPKPRVE